LQLEIEAQYPQTGGTALQVETAYPARPQTGGATLLAVEDAYPSVSTALRSLAPRVHPRQALALTFDTESPHGQEAQRTLVRVLDELHEAGVRATFFVVGWWARDNVDMLRRIVAEGHEVANHTWTHRRFMQRPPAALDSELRAVADIVLRETGKPIAPFFRPPYGCIDEHATRLAQGDGYHVVGWTANGADAQHATRTPQQVLAALLAHLEAGNVVLLHTNHWITAEALPSILQAIELHDLDALPLSELVRRGAVTPAQLGGTGLRDCTWRAARAHNDTLQAHATD
jgi:peptidoglycan/xylan/chitin deacetylase (PgdA/CDA1 family)